MLKHIVNNSAGMEKRVQVEARYIDLAMKGKEKEKPRKPEPTSEEIIDRMKNKLRNLSEER